MSALQQAFEYRLIVRSVRSDPNFPGVLHLIRTNPREDLTALCPATGASLLFYVVQRKDDSEALELCKVLAEELRVCSVTHIDRNSQSALFFAARDGNVQCVEYLLQNNCNPNQQDTANQTALFYAARDGREEVVTALLNGGAELNLVDRHGQTALFYAARDGREGVVQLMIESGADLTMRDRQKRLPSYYASKNGHKELAEILQRACAAASSVDATVPSSKKPRIDPPLKRELYCLAVLAPKLEGEDEASAEELYLLAPEEVIAAFEKQFPHLAVWDRSQPSAVSDLLVSTRAKWQAAATEIMEELSAMEGGWIFARPVDCKAWGCPDYYDIVKHPMDYSTIRKKFKSYRTCAEYLTDMALIFSNCKLYNKPGSPVADIGVQSMDVFMQRMHSSGIWKWMLRERQIVKWAMETYPESASKYAVFNVDTPEFFDENGHITLPERYMLKTETAETDAQKV